MLIIIIGHNYEIQKLNRAFKHSSKKEREGLIGQRKEERIVKKKDRVGDGNHYQHVKIRASSYV